MDLLDDLQTHTYVKDLTKELNPIYSEAELERLKRCVDLPDSKIYDVFSYLDPQLRYDKILEEGVDNYWTIKKNKVGKEQVLIDLIKLKQHGTLQLFLFDTLTWIHNFTFQWLLKYRTICQLKFSDKTSLARNISSVTLGDIGKYVSFTGRVRRISDINVATVSSYYQCGNCKDTFIVDRMWYEKIKEGKCRCATRKSPVQKESLRRYETWQVVTIQDNITQEDLNTQFSLECRVLDGSDFYKVSPGENIKVKGILRTQLTDKAKSRLYLDLYSIEPVVQKVKTLFTPKKIERIKQMADQDELFQKLKTAVFPQILGLNLIKEAAILQFLSGGQTTQRSSVHVLVAGDPGVGKSQILKCIQKTLGGLYATGLGSSVAGLTATVYKDAENQWNLDGGAVVLANGGVLLLDEADKLSIPCMNSLLEPMEQQTVSISKAGMAINLPAKTKIFAVSNPKMNQKFDFNNQLSLIDQLGFTAPFLSRFDIIVLITQKSQKAIQQKMVDSVLNPQLRTQSSPDYIDYMKYAKTLSPTIPSEIKNELSIFYSSLKKKYEPHLTLGPRNLESIARLTEAKAKSRLSEEVNWQDLEYVKNFYIETLETQRPSTSMAQSVPELVDLVLSKKEERYANMVLGVLKERPIGTKQLFMKMVELDPTLTYQIYSKTVKSLEDNGVIYKPDNLLYHLVVKID